MCNLFICIFLFSFLCSLSLHLLGIKGIKFIIIIIIIIIIYDLSPSVAYTPYVPNLETMHKSSSFCEA